MSDEATRCLIATALLIFRFRRFPRCIDLLLARLIPKAGGGSRPIGLIVGIVRAFNAFLLPVVAKQWEAKNTRDFFFFGERDRDCEACAWRSAARAEFANYMGVVLASGLLDMHKAFDLVKHSILQKEAGKHGFDEDVVLYYMSIYRGPRSLLFGQVATKVVRAKKSIVAGCSFSTTLFRLYYLCPRCHSESLALSVASGGGR